MKREIPVIDGKRITLRKLRLSDAGDIYKCLQDKDIIRWTRIPWPYTLREAKSFIRRTHGNIRAGTAYAFGIELRETEKIIGIISLIDVDLENRCAEIGYWLCKKYWGKGISDEAVHLILEFAFNELNLHKIYGYIIEGNTASRRLLERCGFQYEGFLRESLYKDKKFYSEYVYGLLSRDFMKKQKV